MDDKSALEIQGEQPTGTDIIEAELRALMASMTKIDQECKSKNEIIEQNAALISSLKKDISDLLHRNTELSEESKICMGNFNETIEKFRHCGFLISALKQKSDDYDRLLEESKIWLHKADARAQDLVQTKKDLINFRERLIQDFEERKKELSVQCDNEVQELLQKKREKLEQLQSSREQIEALKLTKEELESELFKCQENVTELQDSIQNKESCLDELDKWIENKEAQLSSIDSEINDLRTKFINLQELNDNAEVEDKPTYQKLDDLIRENEMLDLNLAAANLPNEIENLNVKIMQLKSELDSQLSADDLKLLLGTNNQELEAVKAEIKSCADKISELNYKEEDPGLPDRIKSVEEKIEEILMEIAATKQGSEICKEKCSIKKQEHDDLLQKYHDLEKQNQGSECRKVDLQQQFEQSQMKSKKLKEKLSSLEEECCRFREKIDDLEKTKKDLDIKVLGEELMEKTMVEEYKRQLAEKELKQTELHKQISSLKCERSIILNKNASYRRNIREMEKKFEENKKNDSQLNEKLIESKKQVAELDEELKEKNLKITSLKESHELLTSDLKFKNITLKNIKDSDDERIKNYYLALQSLSDMAKCNPLQ